MKYVYLDTSHLQKWVNRKLPVEKLACLDKLKENQVIFVFSIMHILEIVSAPSPAHVIKMANFIESLPHVWLKCSQERMLLEVKYAHNKFLKRDFLALSVFSDKVVDILPPMLYSLELNLGFKKGAYKMREIFLIYYKDPTLKSIDNAVEKIFPDWSKRNAKIAKNLSDWKKEVEKRFKERVIERVIQFAPDIIVKKENVVAFCDYLCRNLSLIKSFSLDFYVQHLMHKNPGRKWGANDIGDLEHCSALPYVDFLSCDNQMYDLINQARRKFKKLDFIKSKVVKDILQIDID